jgi:hypothetical protein
LAHNHKYKLKESGKLCSKWKWARDTTNGDYWENGRMEMDMDMETLEEKGPGLELSIGEPDYFVGDPGGQFYTFHIGNYFG